MKPVYYNDNDPYCVQWLRNLIAAGHLPAGEVDDRPIQSVKPSDLGRFGQRHFFAGIGGWPLALRLAGWPDDRPVWTGSCPCQPFSAAGKRKGTADERHLWPEFLRLIGECRPASVFGEQVASKDGRAWLAGVRADLEALGYAIGAGDICAAGVGAPHIRQRLYWMADTGGEQRRALQRTGRTDGARAAHVAGCSDSGRMADAEARGLGINGSAPRRAGHADERSTIDSTDGGAVRFGDADCSAQARLGPECIPLEPEQETGRSGDAGYWSNTIVIGCADGKTRRIEPTIFPLAHAGEWGTGSRVGILRGAGNAIVPALAAEFVAACMECRP